MGTFCVGMGLGASGSFLMAGSWVELKDLEDVVVEEVEIKGLVAFRARLGRGCGVMEGCLPLEESVGEYLGNF